jgi:hypothetical protein
MVSLIRRSPAFHSLNDMTSPRSRSTRRFRLRSISAVLACGLGAVALAACSSSGPTTRTAGPAPVLGTSATASPVAVASSSPGTGTNSVPIAGGPTANPTTCPAGASVSSAAGVKLILAGAPSTTGSSMGCIYQPPAAVSSATNWTISFAAGAGANTSASQFYQEVKSTGPNLVEVPGVGTACAYVDIEGATGSPVAYSVSALTGTLIVSVSTPAGVAPAQAVAVAKIAAADA